MRALDLRLCLRGRDDRCVAMDFDSVVIFGSSAFFAAMVPDASAGGGGGRRVEVDGLDNLEAFEYRETKQIAVLEVRCIPFVSFPFRFLLSICFV